MKLPEHRPWQVLDSEYVAREAWFTVRRERCRLPDGRTVPRYFVFEYPEWVNVIARTKDGLFVMIDQYRHGLGRTSYELAAGVADPTDESMEAAARRELMEETGFGGGKWRKLMSVCANPATQTNMTHCFVAEGVERQGVSRPDDTEDLRTHLMTREEVLTLLRDGGIVQALHAAPLWRYFAETER
ncbi:MAG: NUDIX hydrolase [Alistipes sp.]|nr:NUDIX hydrolase [Alistipes sp.]